MQVRDGRFVEWRAEGGGGAGSELVGLRTQDVVAAGRAGAVCVVEAASAEAADRLAAALEARADVTLAGAWVSLDRLGDFAGRLRAEDPDADVDAALKAVLADIEWGVLSGLFEFTVINDDPGRALGELQAAARYVAGIEDPPARFAALVDN